MFNLLIQLIYWTMAGSGYAALAIMLKRAIQHKDDWPRYVQWKQGWIDHSIASGAAKWPFYDGLGG